MAGAGYKSWSTGDLVSASDFNTYIGEQTVMVFADSSARSSAISSASEGMITFLKDDDTLYYANASGTWVAYVGSGDISAVTITTASNSGLAGGSTASSGAFSSTLTADLNNLTVATVNVANDSIAIIDADASNGTRKESIADLVSAMAGTNVTASAGVLSASGGKILQVVTGTTTTDTGVTASTSFTDTGLTADITPSATSSKVLVIMSQTLQYARDSGEQTGYYNIMRDSTEILDATYNGSGGGSGANFGPVTISSIIMDSPSSTSALTYKTQIRCETTANSGSVRANQQTSGSETPSSIQLVEIGA
jgi:hypothetical protein